MKRWPTKPLGEFIEERTKRLRQNSATIYSVTNENGFVRSLDLFDKRVFSADTGNYKHVEFRASPITHRVSMSVQSRGEDKDGGAVSPMYIIVRSKSGLLPHYLLHFLKSKTGLHQIRQRCEGAIRFQLKFRDLCAIPIVAPPLREQEKIVKQLDEADALRKLRVQTDHRTSEFLPALFHEMFGDPIRSAKKIAIVRVEEAGRVQLGRQRAPKYQTGKFTRPYVRVANVFEDRIDVSDLLSMDFDERDFQQYRLEHGDILLNEGQSTELVGRPAMWRNEVPDCCFHKWTLLRFQPNRKKVLPISPLGLFLTYFRTGEFAKLSGKTSSIAHLGAGRFAKMPFVFPPMPLQKKFAQRVTEIRELEAGQAASRRRLEELFQSLLHRAFNGEL